MQTSKVLYSLIAILTTLRLEGRLSLGEVALWLRRCFPAYAARPVAQLCGELRDALEGRGAVTEHAARGEKEANSGAVWAVAAAQ